MSDLGVNAVATSPAGGLRRRAVQSCVEQSAPGSADGPCKGPGVGAWRACWRVSRGQFSWSGGKECESDRSQGGKIRMKQFPQSTVVRTLDFTLSESGGFE